MYSFTYPIDSYRNMNTYKILPHAVLDNTSPKKICIPAQGSDYSAFISKKFYVYWVSLRDFHVVDFHGLDLQRIHKVVQPYGLFP